MVAIFAGTGFGFERGSGALLGGAGLLGSAAQGRGGEGVAVNVATGNLVLQKQDEFLVGLGPDAGISRTYNSLTNLADDNNDKWRQSTDRRVYGLSGTLNATGSTVKRVSGDGTEIVYSWDTVQSAYVTHDGAGAYDKITNDGTEWKWTDGDTQTVERYVYDATGRIKSVTDRNNSTLTFSYDGSNRLSQLTTSDGSWLRYEWVGSTNNIADILTGYTDLVTATSKTLTRTRYGYDGSNRLTTVTTDITPGDNSVSDGATYVTTYGYDGSGRVNSIAQSDGSSLAITYDASNRVETLVQTVSSGVTRTTTLTYGIPGSNYTLVNNKSTTDATGQTIRLDYDGSGNLSKITAPPAYSGAAQQIVQFNYNTNGDVTSTTDALGNATTYSNFTANGLAQTITDRLGNVVTRSYDSNNLLLSETSYGVNITGNSVPNVTRYTYNAAGNLRFVRSPKGRLTEYTVNTAGYVIAKTDYPEDGVSSAPTPNSGQASETEMANWVAGMSDRSWVEQTQYAYDARGALQVAVSYGIASTAGAGLTGEGYGVQHYTYDQAGQLLSSYSGSNTATTYAYDGMGRVISTTDANGGTTTIAFNDATTTTMVTLASGYVSTKTYNKAGDLISLTDSGTNTTGGTTGYSYDALGRVRVRTDATSLKTYTLYDAAGRHVGDVDADGDLTEYVYDAGNRLIGTFNYHNKVSGATLTNLANPDYAVVISSLRPSTSTQDTKSWVVYDKEGRVLETIAGDGSATISTYDASGRLQQTTAYTTKIAQSTVDAFITAPPSTVITPSASASDVVARNFYDKDGILIATLDGEGYLTYNIYDGSGQLTASTAYATATTTSLRATGSFGALLNSLGTSAQDRTSHFVYDGRGLLRFTVDALNQAVRYDYDTAGQKTSATVYAAAMSATSDYTYDNVKALTASLEGNSANRRSFMVYDAAGRLAYGIDAAGSVANYKYDNRGQVVRTIAYASSYATTSLPALATMDSWSASTIGNAANRVTRVWYTERGEAAYSVDAEGYVIKRDYDAKGQLKTLTAWPNKVTVSDTTTLVQVAAAVSGTPITRKWDYDSLGRTVRSYDGVGVTTTYSYHGATSLVNTVVEAANGTAVEQATTGTVYDAAGRAVQVTDATGITATRSFNGLGLLTSGTSAVSLSVAQTTNYTYDLDGRIKTVTDAAGGLTSYEYNAFGQVWKTTDPNGNISYSWYDALGRVTTGRDAGDYLTTTSYTVFGEVATVQRWMTPVSGTASLTTAPTVSGTVATTSFSYDAAGRVKSTTDANGNGGVAAYANGSYTESFTETYAYDTLGNRTSVTSKLGAVTTYSYDRLGNLLRQQIAASTSNYAASGNYDGSYNLTGGSVTSGGYNVVAYSYDAYGNRKQLIEGYSTTDGGAVTALRTTNYFYDANNRVTSVTHDTVTVVNDDIVSYTTATPTEQYSYDARGNVIRAIAASGAATYAYYDALDRKVADIRQLTGDATPQWVYTAYSYDANGNLVATRVYDANGSATMPSLGGGAPGVPSGTFRETDFAYDSLNRLLTSTVVGASGNAITSGSWTGSVYAAATGNLVTTYQYDADGNVVKLTDANGSVTWNWYDKLGRKTAMLDGEGFLSAWVYNADGNALSETRFATRFTGTPSLSSAPTVAAGGDDRTTVFTYDLVGNRLTEKRTGVVAWNVDAATGALSAAGTDSVVSYQYNALGQVVTKTVAGAQIAAYRYDQTGRLFSEQRAAFVDANGSTVTPTSGYSYDALGDLVATTQVGAAGAVSTAARTTTSRYGEGGRLLSSVDAMGNVHAYYYDVAGRLKKDAYSRQVNSDTTTTSSTTTTVAEAQAKTYDLAGRVLTQSIYTTVSGSLQRLGYTSFQYNNFDQVVQQGTGSTAAGMNSGLAAYQVTNQYDAAGRLTGTNSGDGVWKFFGYDKVGNQTVVIASAGYAFSAGTGFSGALAQVSSNAVNATYTVYDRRNAAVQVVDEGRDLSASVTNQTLITYRSYTAFGEVKTETNALGATLTYTYNTMGRLIRSESPGVQITAENGASFWVNPSEDNYYDLAGRLIGARDANGSYATTGTNAASATAKVVNTGNLTTMALLAGTGYDRSQGLVATEFHVDGGRKQTLYDIMGDARVIRDELYTAAAPNLHVTEQSFNALGQLVQVKHNRATNVADDTTRLIDNYVYDLYGQQLQHATNQTAIVRYIPSYGGPFNGPILTPVYGNYLDKTGYDALGRITSQTDGSGYVTSTAYAWDGTLTTASVGTLGGWVQTTTYANARTAISKQDLYNRELFKQDLGGHQFTATFDAAGRQITRGGQQFTWYNSGLVASSATVTGALGTDDWDRKLTTYGYDAVGNRVSESLINDGSRSVYHPPSGGYSHYYQYPNSNYYGYWTVETYANQYVNETATYDALGRLTSMTESGTPYFTPAASITEQYDAVGNIRRTTSTHVTLNQNGAASATVTDDYWFRYDAMNRLVTDKGVLSGAAGAVGTTVVRGNAAYGTAQPGQDYVYDLTGQRVAALRTDYSPGSQSYYGYYSPGYYQETRENYDYDGAGRVTAIRVTQGAGVSETYDYSTGLTTAPTSIPAASASGGVNRSLFGYDLSGRQTSQTDYDANGTAVVYSRSASYALNGQLTSDNSSTLKFESNGYSTATYRTSTSYTYTAVDTGEYLLGAVGSVDTSNYKNGSYQNASNTTNTYIWYDSAVQGTIAYKPNTSQNTVFNTYFGYDQQGTITSATINDGRPRNVTYRTNADGQIIRRDETPSNSTVGPHEIWYRFAGKEFGYVGNNGTSKVTEDASIADRRAYQNTGAFRNGSSYAAATADFAQSSTPINSYSQGSSAGGYTVQRSGETLRSVAQQVWGDASLWYKLADANGMKGDMALTEGQRLSLPAGISRTRNNASTLTPYNPNDAIGNVSPTTPKPAASNKCGVFGAILLAIIAIAVTLIIKAPVAHFFTGLFAGSAAAGTAAGATAAIAGSVVGGTVTAAVASAVSQGIGIATGIQDKFSWKAVGLAGLTAFLGPVPVGKVAGSAFLGNVIGGALTNAAVQGIAVATGLQSKFDFAGVAAAGIGAGVGNALGAHFTHGASNGFTFGEQLVTNAASGLANAATRSVLEGTDFGDNIIAALPDIIGNTIGGFIASKLAGGGNGAATRAAEKRASQLSKYGVPLKVDGDGNIYTDASQSQISDMLLKNNPDIKIGHSTIDFSADPSRHAIEQTNDPSGRVLNYYEDNPMYGGDWEKPEGSQRFDVTWIGNETDGAIRFISKAGESGSAYLYVNGTERIAPLGLTVQFGQATPNRPDAIIGAIQDARYQTELNTFKAGIAYNQAQVDKFGMAGLNVMMLPLVEVASLRIFGAFGTTLGPAFSAIRPSFVRGSTVAAERAGINIASGVGASAPASVVRTIQRGERISNLVNEGKSLTFTTGNEHAVVTLANGERALVSGGPGGIRFAPNEVTRIFGHTHPTSAPPSAADFFATGQLGQSRQYVFHGGEVSVVRPIK